MRKITAKFNSTCSETGARIKKGDQMYYDSHAKKCYSINSERGKFEASNAGTVWAAANEDIQDPGEQYYDNWCMNNGM